MPTTLEPFATTVARIVPIEQVHAGNNSRSSLEIPAALIHSVKEAGIINPISVKADSPDNYTIIAGHRRHAAALKAGLSKIPCMVYNGELKEGDERFIALAENHHRLELSDMDYADAFAAQSNKTDKEIGALFGVTPQFVRQRRGLSSLNPKIKKWIRNNKLSIRQAERITCLTNDQQQELSKHLNKADFHTVLWDTVNSATRISTKEALFSSKLYDGEYTSDLFSDNSVTYFADETQANTLQIMAVQDWATKFTKQGWIVHSLPEGKDTWDGYSYQAITKILPETVAHEYTELHSTSREKPLAWLRFIKTLPTLIPNWNDLPESKRTLVITNTRARGRYEFVPFLAPTKNMKTNGTANDVVKPKWGPTMLQSMAAHKGDILTEEWLTRPCDIQMIKFAMAVVVLEAGDITLGHTDYSSKVEGRKELTRPVRYHNQGYQDAQDALALIENEDLSHLFARIVGARIGLVDALPGTSKKPTVADVMAQILGIQMNNLFQPTQQVLRQFDLKQLKTIARLNKVRQGYLFHQSAKKKDLVKAIVSHFEKNPKSHYCHPDFEFVEIKDIKDFDIEKKFGIPVKST